MSSADKAECCQDWSARKQVVHLNSWHRLELVGGAARVPPTYALSFSYAMHATIARLSRSVPVAIDMVGRGVGY